MQNELILDVVSIGTMSQERFRLGSWSTNSNYFQLCVLFDREYDPNGCSDPCTQGPRDNNVLQKESEQIV